MSAFGRGLLACLALVVVTLVPRDAAAASLQVRILLDLDNDSATGCSVDTPAGPFSGVEQILIADIETSSPPPAATVTEVAIADCINPQTDTFGAPVPFDGNWPVGLGNGEGGLNVVETYFPLVSSVVPAPTTVRLAVVLTGDRGEERALLTVDGTENGAPILLTVREQGLPTLSTWGLALAFLGLLLLATRSLARRRSGWAAVTVLLAGTAALAAVTLDGQTSDWSPEDKLASNDLVLFGRRAMDRIFFRLDYGAPVVDSVEVTPADPALDGMVTATVVASGMGTVTLTYVWEVNAAVVQTTPDSPDSTDVLDLSPISPLAVGDPISVEVTPYDGVVSGFPVTAQVQWSPQTTGISDQFFSGPGLFVLDVSGSFTDPNSDILSFSATLADSSPLPPWLSISAVGVLSGDPSITDAAVLDIRVTATDPAGLSVFTDFQLNVSNTPDSLD